MPTPDDTVAPGEPFHIYVELSGVHACSGMFRKGYETSVGIAVQVVDSKGRQLQQHLFSDLKVTASELPRWVHRPPKFKLADDIPPGSYRLTLQVTDELQPDKPTVSASLPLVVRFSESQ